VFGDDAAPRSFMHPVVIEIAGREGMHADQVLELLETRSPRLPSTTHDLLATSHSIPPEWHLRVQAAFQDHVEAGISKTINLPPEASVAEVRAAIVMAHRLGLKGITVFRNESRPDQPLKLVGVCLACDAPDRELPAEPAEPIGPGAPSPTRSIGAPSQCCPMG
jgi:ribonucleoside-diphosphate reductase alpha chain